MQFYSYRSLDETNRNVYKENTALIDSLRIHKHELDELQKSKEQFSKLIATTSNDKELHEVLIKEKLEQVQKQHNSIREVRKLYENFSKFYRLFIS